MQFNTHCDCRMKHITLHVKYPPPPPPPPPPTHTHTHTHTHNSEISRNDDQLTELKMYKEFLDALAPQVTVMGIC